MAECPILKTPPKEIRSQGFTASYGYLRRLLSGSVECKRTKLMLVGLGEAGKTRWVSWNSYHKCIQYQMPDFLFKLVMIWYMHVKKALDVDLEYFRSFGIYSSRIHFMNVTLLFYHCVLKLGKSSSIWWSQIQPYWAWKYHRW